MRSFGKVRALRGLDLDVPEGSLFGLLGPNGAGKTTTIRVLATIIPPDRGRAWVLGLDVIRQSLAVRERIGLMVEDPGFHPDMTVLGNLLHHASYYDIDDAGDRAMDLLRAVRLHHVADRPAVGLSFGMRKRLALAQALVTAPEVLLLDEPLTGLDPEGIVHARDLIRRVNGEGATVFMSTHILSEVEALCDRVAIVHRGRVVAQGTTEEIRGLLPEGAGRYVEIRVRGAGREILDELAALGTVTPAPWGLTIHRFEGRPEDVAARANAVLVENGLEVTGIIHREMSLEAVYLEVLGRRRRRRKGPGRR